MELYDDAIFNQLVSLAFSRNSCEVDSFYSDPSRHCRYCLIERMALKESNKNHIRRPPWQWSACSGTIDWDADPVDEPESEDDDDYIPDFSSEYDKEACAEEHLKVFYD